MALPDCLSFDFVENDVTVDLEEIIVLPQSALDLCPAGHSNRSDSLHNRAVCFSRRYDKQGTIADLQEAITLCRAALELRSPGHSHRAVTLYDLAIHLWQRFRKVGASGDLDEAIVLHRSALDLRPAGHSDRSDSLYYLAICFGDRYCIQGTVADVDEAITLGRAALELRSPDHSHRAATLYDLAIYLWETFRKVGASGDLDVAIALHRSALDLRLAGHPDRLRSLNELANCLSSRLEKLDAAADLDELISLHQAILDHRDPQGHHYHAMHIDQLFFLVRKRIQRHDMAADLGECISLGRSALASYQPGNPSHATYLHDLVTDLYSRLCRLENISDVHDAHPDSAASLQFLIYVKDLVGDGDVTPVVDVIVAIARATLKLCPAGHPHHVMSLTTLAAFLLRRFQQQGTVPDVDEAVIRYREALEVCPSGSPASAPLLHDLARCLSERFTKLATWTDLDDAIKFEQAALELRPQGHPDHAESLLSLYNYRQLKIKGRGASTQSARPTGITSGSQFKSLIGDIVFDVLKGFPPRLLDTRTGKLCDRDSQITQFEKSGEYGQLLSSMSTMDTSAQVTHIREVVSTYFRYVTLSHRWGKFEPLLRDIHGRVIYDLDPTDGLSKLQFFCQECCRHGYFWAWSDTCCIDKESSAELQEAIGFMFSWYRLSALTMVHLADALRYRRADQ